MATSKKTARKQPATRANKKSVAYTSPIARKKNYKGNSPQQLPESSKSQRFATAQSISPKQKVSNMISLRDVSPFEDDNVSELSNDKISKQQLDEVDLNIFLYVTSALLDQSSELHVDHVGLQIDSQEVTEFFKENFEVNQGREQISFFKNKGINGAVLNRMLILEAYELNEDLSNASQNEPSYDFNFYKSVSGDLLRLVDLLIMVSKNQAIDCDEYSSLIVNLLAVRFGSELKAAMNSSDNRLSAFSTESKKALAERVFTINNDGGYYSPITKKLKIKLRNVNDEIKRGSVRQYFDYLENTTHEVKAYLSGLLAQINNQLPYLYTVGKAADMLAGSNNDVHVASPQKYKREYQVEPIKKQRRPKKAWTDEETDILANAMARYGHNWAGIIKEYSDELPGRTGVDLKDRARNVRKMFLASGKPLGIWN